MAIRERQPLIKLGSIEIGSRLGKEINVGAQVPFRYHPSTYRQTTAVVEGPDKIKVEYIAWGNHANDTSPHLVRSITLERTRINEAEGIKDKLRWIPN